MATTTKSNKKKPDYLTLRRQLGSNVFKKQPKKVSYYGQTMSSYYNNAYQYVNESIKEYTKTSTYTNSTGGSGGSGGGSSAPNVQENTRRVEDELRKQMIKSEETINKYMNLGYVPFIGEDGKPYTFDITTKDGKENPLVDYMYRTPGFQEAFKIALDPTSNFSDRREALEQMQNMISLEMPNLPPEAGKYVAYAYTQVNPYGKDVMEYYDPNSYYMPSAKNYDIGQWLFSIADNPFNDLTPYDRTQVRSAANAVSTGNFVEYSRYENTLKPIIEKANSPESIIKTEEGKYYLQQKDAIYKMINDPNTDPLDKKFLTEVYNNMEKKQGFSDDQFKKLAEYFPEAHQRIVEFDGGVETLIKNIQEASPKYDPSKPTIITEASQIVTDSAIDAMQPSKVGQSVLGAMLSFMGDDKTSINKLITGVESKGGIAPINIPIFSNVSLQFSGIPGVGGITVGNFEVNPAEWVLGSVSRTIFGTDIYGRPDEPTGWDYLGTALVALQVGTGVAGANGISLLSPLRETPVIGKYIGMIDDALSGSKGTASNTDDAMRAYHNRNPTLTTDYNPTGLKMSPNTTASYIPEGGIPNVPKPTPTPKYYSGYDPNFPATSTNIPMQGQGGGNPIINFFENVQEYKVFTSQNIGQGARASVKAAKDAVSNPTVTFKQVVETTTNVAQKNAPVLKETLKAASEGHKLLSWQNAKSYLKTATFVGFGGFVVIDTLMQFDDLAIANAVKDGSYASAVGRLDAYQFKHNYPQKGITLATEAIMFPFAIVDALLGTNTSYYIPMLGATLAAYGDYRVKGNTRAAELEKIGLWKGDFVTGKAATREDVALWYKEHRNDRNIFTYGATDYKHAHYKAIIDDPEYDTKVKNASVSGITPSREILSNILDRGTQEVAAETTNIRPQEQNVKPSEMQTIASDILKNATDISQVQKVAKDLGVNLEGRMQFTSDKSLEGYKNALLTEIRDNEKSPFTIDRRDKNIYAPAINQERSNYFKKVDTPETIKWDYKNVPQAATYGGQGAFNYNQPTPDPSWSSNISDDRPWLNEGQNVFDWSNVAAQNPMTQQRYDQMVNEEQQRIYDQFYTPSLNFTFAELMATIEYDPIEAMKKDKKT